MYVYGNEKPQGPKHYIQNRERLHMSDGEK